MGFEGFDAQGGAGRLGQQVPSAEQAAFFVHVGAQPQIGRASCRERVGGSGGGQSGIEKAGRQARTRGQS